MSHHIQIYQKFLKEYILNHSAFQINDLVRVKGYHHQHEYQISRVVVDSSGEFSYEATSPRSHSILPMLFKAESLEKI